jgi:hypothetical protein
MRGPRLITSSSARCYRLCPRKYRLSYVQGLRPKRDAFALRFGTLWHALMEVWWGVPADEVAIPSDVDPFDRAKANAMLAGYTARWRDHRTSRSSRSSGVPGPCATPGREVEGWAVAGKVDGSSGRTAGTPPGAQDHSEDLTRVGTTGPTSPSTCKSRSTTRAPRFGHPSSVLYTRAKPQLRSGPRCRCWIKRREDRCGRARPARHHEGRQRWRQDAGLGAGLPRRPASRAGRVRAPRLEAIASGPTTSTPRRGRAPRRGAERLAGRPRRHGPSSSGHRARYWPRTTTPASSGAGARMAVCSGTGTRTTTEG